MSMNQAQSPESEQQGGAQALRQQAAQSNKPATLMLAHDPKFVRAKTTEEGGGTEKVYHTPPTADGEVNIGGSGSIYLPSLEAQRAGFMPFFVRREKAKPATIDLDSGAEATRVLLEQFPGIYKPVERKGV